MLTKTAEEPLHTDPFLALHSLRTLHTDLTDDLPEDDVKVKRTRSRISKKIKPIDAPIPTNVLESLATDPVASRVPIANIILHLRCSIQDLNAYNESCKQQLRATSTFTYDPTIPPVIQAYDSGTNIPSTHFGSLHFVPGFIPRSAVEVSVPRPLGVLSNNSDQASAAAYTPDYICPPPIDTERSICAECSASMASSSCPVAVDPGQHIYTKLKKLKTLLYKNIQVTDNKSACFWCTYDFDTPDCHIPFYNMNGQVHGYGVFCRPECAVGYLMKEHLDDSTKFERYHLLNRIYGKVFDYKKNIKPAPNPFYMLERYGGNLTIEEYRALLQSNHVLFTIDKPMTRTLPELHEETDDVITSIYENTTGIKMCGSKTGHKAVVNHTTHMGGGAYKARRQSEKVQTAGGHKTNILREHFGLGVNT